MKVLREYSKRVFTLKLPRDFAIHVDVEANGQVQRSISFSMATLFSVKGLSFANRVNSVVACVEA